MNSSNLNFLLAIYNQGQIIVAKAPKPPSPNLNVAVWSRRAAKLIKNIDFGGGGSPLSSTGVAFTFSGAYFHLATYYVPDCLIFQLKKLKRTLGPPISAFSSFRFPRDLPPPNARVRKNERS